MNASSANRRAALDPSIELFMDRYECSMAHVAPHRREIALQRISRAITVGLGAVAATVGAYFLQVGR
ncbi:MAG TPA: hypothetical protein VIM61_12435 [Chthoniobacterales bacterium]|jgi:hypothetical protein